MSNVNWRTINVDALDPDTPPNFPVSSLTPYVVPIAAADVQHLSAQIKQLLRGGDAEGALRSALENSPYGGDAAAKVREAASFRLPPPALVSPFAEPILRSDRRCEISRRRGRLGT